MSPAVRYAARLVPRRAPVVTWMMLTLGASVGVAILAVVLYVQLVLRPEAQRTLEATLAAQAARVAAVLESADTDAARLAAFEQSSRTLDLRFALIDSLWARGDTAVGVRIDYADGKPLIRPDPETPEFAPGDSAAFRTVRDANGQRVRYAAVRLRSGEILEVGQPEPVLFTLVERTRRAVFVGLAIALALVAAGVVLLARSLTRPLHDVRDAAHDIAEGQYDRTLALDSRASEFQDVGKSLTRMADAFRAKIVELERMARVQSEFIGNVSHEVRNPIFAISGYLEALGTPLPEEQRKRYAQKGLASLNRLQSLFTDLIEIARLEHKSEHLLRPTGFGLQGLYDEVGEMLRPRADEKALVLDMGTSALRVHADRNRIRQVVTNLVENAIAYTDEGSVRVRTSARDGRARIEVLDTGKGIPDDKIDRIFERFYRVDPDRARKSGGTGLGLSIVKQILQAHGTTVRVESTLGRGSRFWFDLPIAPDPVPAATDAAVA